MEDDDPAGLDQSVTGSGLPFSTGVEEDRHALDRLDGPATGICEAPMHLPPLQHTDSMTVMCIGIDVCTLYCCTNFL